MAARAIFLAHSYESLHRRAESFFDSASETLLLAPSRGAADDFLRAAARPGFFGVHAFTLPQLAARLASHGELRFTPLSRLAQEALAARIVHSFRKDERFQYFEPVASRPGFIRALGATLTELRMEGVDLRKLAQSGEPGRDLSLLMREYADAMEEVGLADLPLLIQAAIEVIEDGGHPLAGLPLLLLDVPVRHAAEKRFLRALVGRSQRVMAVSLASDAATVDALRKCLGALAAQVEEERRDALGMVRQYLFSPALHDPAGTDGTVSCFSAAGEGLECVEIARRIHALTGSGVAFDRIAVLLRSPERYQPLLEEAFRRAGVGAYFYRGTARPNPAGRAFLALLLCAIERCSASRFAEYLSLAQVPALSEAGEPLRSESGWTPPSDEILGGVHGTAAAMAREETGEATVLVTPYGWERLLVDAAVVGGRERWARRLRGLAEELHLKLDRVSDEDEEARSALESRLERLQVLERFALPLIDLLGSLPAQAVWSDWIEGLIELAETALRYPAPVVSVLRELHPMADVGPVGLDEVYGVLEDRLRFLRDDPPRHRYGQVFVASIEESRGRRFDVVFLPGLAEGLFPRRAAEDPLLLDVHRERTAAHLARQDDRVLRERLLLHVAAAVGDRLVVSYPRIDVGQSRPRVPSFYAMEVLRAAEGKLPDLRAFEKQAAAASHTRLGWPAPPGTEQAIDDVEFDLALLDRISRMPLTKRKGAARYLVEASPTLARSLRTRWRRWDHGWSAVDGIVRPGAAVLDVLAEHRLSARAYSPTALQQFAVCPYRFLLHAVVQLRPRDEIAPLEQMDPLTRGALFHEVQHELLEELREAGMLPLRAAAMEDALDFADAVLDRVAGKYEEKLAPAIPRVFAGEIDELRSDLRGWLRHAAHHASDWRPIHTELSFGLADGAPEVEVPGGYRLRGSVDLVERSGERLRVTDHKTGKPPEGSLSFIGGGKILQPLLYALAVEQLLGEPVSAGRLYYCTHRGGYREIEIPANEAARAQVTRVLSLADAAVRNGFLPAAPERGSCDTCDYRAVCGPYEEVRVRRKDQAPLKALVELRGVR